MCPSDDKVAERSLGPWATIAQIRQSLDEMEARLEHDDERLTGWCVVLTFKDRQDKPGFHCRKRCESMLVMIGSLSVARLDLEGDLLTGGMFEGAVEIPE